MKKRTDILEKRTCKQCGTIFTTIDYSKVEVTEAPPIIPTTKREFCPACLSKIFSSVGESCLKTYEEMMAAETDFLLKYTYLGN
jgi:hypothetical protein